MTTKKHFLSVKSVCVESIVFILSLNTEQVSKLLKNEHFSERQRGITNN